MLWAQQRLTRLATILSRLHVKKVTISILPCDQKLTKDMTKWDSAHKFGTASTAQCPVHNKDVTMMLHMGTMNKKHSGTHITVKMTMGCFNPLGISLEKGLSFEILAQAWM